MNSEDLCGGTGGVGKILNVGTDTFTLTRSSDGSSQLVRLGNQAIIKTANGPASESDLKIGDKVTLVGGPNPDGSFTADTVLVCSGATTETSSVTKQENNNFTTVHTVVDVSTILLLSVIWLGIVAFLRLKKRKTWTHVLFFTIFYVYLIKVLDYTLFQFQSLLLLKHFVPGLMLNGETAGKSLNFIPLITLSGGDVRTSLLNILLMVPFGFGLPFVTNFRFKKVVIAGVLFSIAIELLQFITGLIGNITFRVADINDVIFNTAGVAIGYLIFILFIRIYRRVFRNSNTSENMVLRYINERPQGRTRLLKSSD